MSTLKTSKIYPEKIKPLNIKTKNVHKQGSFIKIKPEKTVIIIF